jgi:hypothetical protein
LPPALQDRLELPGRGPEKGKQSAGSIASQRTKALAPQRSMRTIKPNTTVTNQLKAAAREKQDLKPASMALISRIMAPHLSVFRAKVFGAVRINV